MYVDKVIKNYITNESYHLVSADNSYIVTDNNLKELHDICNEPLIYKEIFQSNLHGKTYPIKKAQKYFDWSNEGWQTKSYFNFILLSPDNKICGNIDIKSNNLAAAEVGYFVSANHKGIITNAVKELISFAKSKKYKSLYAYTTPKNYRSQQVLKRCKFKEVNKHKYKKDDYSFFLLKL